MIANNIWINNRTLVEEIEIVEVKDRKELKKVVFDRAAEEALHFINDEDSFYYDHSEFTSKGKKVHKDFFNSQLTVY